MRIHAYMMSGKTNVVTRYLTRSAAPDVKRALVQGFLSAASNGHADVVRLCVDMQLADVCEPSNATLIYGEAFQQVDGRPCSQELNSL